MDAHKCKDTSILFDDKKSIIVDKINKDIKEYNGVKFSLSLSLQFFKDEKDGIINYFKGQRHGEQCPVLDGNNVNEFYNEQVANIERWNENFTNAEGTDAAVDHCIKLYLNVAKYEPLKSSSYVSLPKILANKKAMTNVYFMQ